MGSTTLTKPDSVAQLDDFGRGGRGFGGFGGGDRPEHERERVPSRSYVIAMAMALAAIVMLFAAFTSALVVRKGLSFDWVSMPMPRVLWLNTALLLASSLTLELARRALGAHRSEAFARWLYVTTGLGVAFVAGQLLAWRELAAQGVYLATNPSSSFFYVFTAAHGLHLLGGIAALLYLVVRAGPIAAGRQRRIAVDVTALYWHFMDGLWIYILFLLMTRF
jgi:cytochrome c oxidase subunit 3